MALRTAVLAALLSCLLAACAHVDPPSLRFGSVAAERRIAPGLTYVQVRRAQPALQSIHLIRIDLRRRGVSFLVSPGDRSKGMEYVAETPTAFLGRYKLSAAVNGGYFLPFNGGADNGDDYYPHAGDPVNVSGLSISGGRIDSPAEPAIDRRVNATLCMRGRRLWIVDGQDCKGAVDGALAAGPRLLAEGAVRSYADADLDYGRARHPRTAVGLDVKHGLAWLLVVDGRQPELSEGATLDELTALFQDLGADDAINLDGGGSSEMVATVGGRVRVLNSPIHTHRPGRERPSANQLGVIAR